MIRGIVGGTGGGKSLLATRYITESLIQTNAMVVTNVPLVMGELYQYVSKHRPPEALPFDLDADVRVLKDEDVMEFYRYRSGGLVLPSSPDMDDGDDGTKRLPKQEFIARMKDNFALMKQSPEYQRPVHYFIDEAHNFFGSRDWKSNGRALLYYASQHRHLHDEIFLITQVIDDVEKQFRDRILETHKTVNMLRMRVGMFRAKPCFRVEVYTSLPGGNKKPQYSKDYDARELDVNGIAKCYKTVGALGVHSSPEAKPNKAPFPHWMLWATAIAGVVMVAAGLFALPYMGSWIGKGVVKGTMLGAQSGTSAAMPGRVIQRQLQPAPSGDSTASLAVKPVMPGLPPGQDAIPMLNAIWFEFGRNGEPVVHAHVEGAPNEIPVRWITAYNMNDYPSAWVEANPSSSVREELGLVISGLCL